ncbi:hypothetical protein Tco_0344518 [Tanacetum coccineum]
MSNTNNNMQTQTSSALHNAIMDAGGKDRPPILAPESTLQIQMDYKTNPGAEVSSENHYRRKQRKIIVNSPSPTYDQEPKMVVEDDALSKENEIDKLMALISLSFKKIYKPTNNNLRISSNTSRAHHDNTPRINKGTGYNNHREKMLLCKQEEAGIQLSVEQVDWRDDTDDEPEDQELEAHYLYMAKIQEVTPNAADNSGPIFDSELLQKVQNDNDNYNVFANDREHLEQLESVDDTYLEEQGDTNKVDHVVQLNVLEKELSKRTDNVNNKSFNELSKRFSELEQHSINLELTLQQSQKQLNNDKVWKQKESNSFRELNVEYFEIQDLKAQLQDKDIAISKLKKLIEKMKEKTVETKFEKSSVIRQPNAFKKSKTIILGKPTTFSDSLAKKDFSKSKSVTMDNVSNDFSNPVTAQILP